MKHSLFQSPVIANRAETGHDDQKIGAAMLLHESDTGHDAALGIDTTMCSTSIGLAKGIAAGGYKPSAKR